MTRVVCVLFLLAACGDDVTVPDFPDARPCTSYETMMISVDDAYVVPSIVPADAGIRIIVEASFQPFMGASYPVPGGRLIWNVWIFRWFDGEHLGAIGRGAGDMCRWYPPVI